MSPTYVVDARVKAIVGDALPAAVAVAFEASKPKAVASALEAAIVGDAFKAGVVEALSPKLDEGGGRA